jgi:hypothetical protein
LARQVGAFACHNVFFFRYQTAILDDSAGRDACRDSAGRDTAGRDTAGRYSAGNDCGSRNDYNSSTVKATAGQLPFSVGRFFRAKIHCRLKNQKLGFLSAKQSEKKSP